MSEAEEIEQLIDELLSGGYDTSSEALRKLVECGEPAVEPLLATLRTRMNDLPSPPLMTELTPENPVDSKEMARMYLTILYGLKNSHGQIVPLIYTLSKIGDDRAIEPSIQALRYAETQTAMDILMDCVVKYGSKAVEPLVESLQAESLRQRLAAIHALLRLPDVRAAEPLIALISGRDSTFSPLQKAAAEALAQIKHPTAQDAIARLLRFSVDGIRGWAACALASTRDARAIEPLIDIMLHDKDPGSRSNAAGKLANFRDNPSPSIVQAYVEALNDEDADVRNIVRFTLEEIGKAAHTYLQKLFAEKPEVIRRSFIFWSQEELRQAKDQIHPGQDESVEEAKQFYILKGKAYDCPLCGKPANELAWVYVSSPQETWEMLAGRAGWITVCEDCFVQVQFILTRMN